MYAMLEGWDRIGILLVYHPLCCPTDSQHELSRFDLGCCIGAPSHLSVLGDFNVHTEAPEAGAAQVFMAVMTTMGLTQQISVPTHKVGYLDLVFTAR